MSGTWVASPRRRRRNLLLLAGLVPSLIAVLVAVALLVMLQRQAAGVAAERRGAHESGRVHFAANRWFGTVEHWVAPYNEGVATFGTGAYADALADFQVALDLAPVDRQCLVLHNIAVTQEAIGDHDRGSAVSHYRRGRSTLGEEHCLVRADVDRVLRRSSLLLDTRLRDKIAQTLAEQARADLAARSRIEQDRIHRAEQLGARAERREQALQDEQAAAARRALAARRQAARDQQDGQVGQDGQDGQHPQRPQHPHPHQHPHQDQHQQSPPTDGSDGSDGNGDGAVTYGW